MHRALWFLTWLRFKGWLRRLARGDYGDYDNFFNDVLEPLFYDTLATDRGHDAWCKRFNCRIPFLNGGLFDDDEFRPPQSKLRVRNETFAALFNDLLEGYNFTVREDTPLEQEVAIDPEMLGKIFESLVLQLEQSDSGGKTSRHDTGSYYTPSSLIARLIGSIASAPCRGSRSPPGPVRARW